MVIVNGAWDPRDGAAGLDDLERQKERYKIRGVKLYTAEWKGDSRGWETRFAGGGNLPRQV